jgi:hypothetical protein
MSDIDLAQTDSTVALGARVLGMLAEGYDGQQVAEACGVDAERAMEALTVYAGRILAGTVSAHPSAECGARSSYDSWCNVHGVFHPTVGGAA